MILFATAQEINSQQYKLLNIPQILNDKNAKDSVLSSATTIIGTRLAHLQLSKVHWITASIVNEHLTITINNYSPSIPAHENITTLKIPLLTNARVIGPWLFNNEHAIYLRLLIETSLLTFQWNALNPISLTHIRVHPLTTPIQKIHFIDSEHAILTTPTSQLFHLSYNCKHK